MPILPLRVAFKTKESQLLVENELSEGQHVFRLEVVDDDGLLSDPFDVVVTVVDRTTIDPGTVIVGEPIIRPPIIGTIRPVII